MARRKKAGEPLPTIWRMDDELWAQVEKVLAELDPPAHFGPDRIDQRTALDGVIYRMRSGVQWNRLPEEYGDDSSVHRTFQRWVKRGVIGRSGRCWSKDCEELGGVDWRVAELRLCLGKGPARGDQVGANPTDRAKNGTKRGVLTEADGGPVAVVVAAAPTCTTRCCCRTRWRR